MSQIILLDTHIWFWFINQEYDKFPQHWVDIIEMADKVSISPVSCYEIALAEQKKRLQLPCPTQQWLTEALTPSGISLLPLSADIAAKAVSLSPVHRDPFDRLIIATALCHQTQLASIDSLFPQYSELDGILLSSSI
ncbi:MAG: PIN domain-containing protein [Snowella sp.]|nr:PIN domain-containing protein [Snowella sp.]